MKFALLVAGIIATARGDDAPAVPAIVADARGNGPGRTYQNTLNGPLASAGAYLVQLWNWTTPKETASEGTSGTGYQFYEGAIDAAGAHYYFAYGNAGTPPLVYKVSGGTLTWRVALPQPAWWDFAGNDHLLLTPTTPGKGPGSGQGMVIAAPGVSYYNTPIDAAIYGLSQAGGNVSWVVNASGSAVQNMRLSSDGATLYAHLWNGTLLLITTSSGKITARWDVSGTLGGSAQYTMSVAEGVSVRSKGHPAGRANVAVFTALGNITAVNTATGAVLWSVADPTRAQFPPALGAGYVAKSGRLLIASGGNYLDSFGAAAVDASSGATQWFVNMTSSNYISTVRYPTAQGWEWIMANDGSAYSWVQLLNSANGSDASGGAGRGALPRPPYSGLSFTSAVATSGDGLCGYFTGEGAACDTCQDDVYLISYCYQPAEANRDSNSGSSARPSFVTQYNVQINELCHPDYRQVGLGPAAGAVTVWHRHGIAVYAPATSPQPSKPHSALCR